MLALGEEGKIVLLPKRMAIPFCERKGLWALEGGVKECILDHRKGERGDLLANEKVCILFDEKETLFLKKRDQQPVMMTERGGRGGKKFSSLAEKKKKEKSPFG